MQNTLTTTWSSERPGRITWTPLWGHHDIIAGYLRTTASAFWKCTFRELKRFECTRPAGQGSFISRVGTNTYGATRPASLSLIHESRRASRHSIRCLLFARVYWGWQLAESGWGKLHNLPQVADFFMSLNLSLSGQTALASSMPVSEKQ